MKATFSRYQSITAAVALFLIVDMGVLVMNFFIAAQMKQGAASVNLAGRQRMLSQRMANRIMEDHGVKDHGVRLVDFADIPQIFCRRHAHSIVPGDPFASTPAL